MEREELKKLIQASVEEALAPLKEQQTKWFERITSQEVPKREEKGLSVARIIRALAVAKGDVEKAAYWVRKQFADEIVEKALLAGEGSAGGFLIPEDFTSEIIELLQPQAVVRRMGAISIPMPSGTLPITAITGGATAYYVGESTNITPSQQAFGQIVLTAKKLAALVPISNELLRVPNAKADVIVRNDLISAIAKREDLAFIRGDGTQAQPKGILHWAASGNKFNANSTVNLQTVTEDLGKAERLLKEGNVPFTRPGWLMAPRTEIFLKSLRDANGNFAFRAEMMQGKLQGFPYAVTTQIPTNLGSGGNESEVYLVDFADAIIGETTQMIIEISSEAAYYDGTGVVAAFSRDESVIRVIVQHDFALRHPASAAVIQAVKWGA